MNYSFRIELYMGNKYLVFVMHVPFDVSHGALLSAICAKSIVPFPDAAAR